MIDIAKKRLPPAALSLLVYVGYCGANLFVMRGSLAMYSSYYDFPSWFTNDIWAFFLGGILPFIIFELLTSFGFRMLAVKAGAGVSSIRYGFSLAVIAANVFLTFFKFIYLAVPFAATIINIIIDPAVTLLFVGGYMWYAFKMEYVEKPRFRFVLTQTISAIAIVYGLVAFLNILLNSVG